MDMKEFKLYFPKQKTKTITFEHLHNNCAFIFKHAMTGNLLIKERHNRYTKITKKGFVKGYTSLNTEVIPLGYPYIVGGMFGFEDPGTLNPTLADVKPKEWFVMGDSLYFKTSDGELVNMSTGKYLEFFDEDENHEIDYIIGEAKYVFQSETNKNKNEFILKFPNPESHFVGFYDLPLCCAFKYHDNDTIRIKVNNISYLDTDKQTLTYVQKNHDVVPIGLIEDHDGQTNFKIPKELERRRFRISDVETNMWFVLNGDICYQTEDGFIVCTGNEEGNRLTVLGNIEIDDIIGRASYIF